MSLAIVLHCAFGSGCTVETNYLWGDDLREVKAITDMSCIA